ncbi:MAG: alpha/beta hydrolase [Hyphomicrobiales bacterium]|nr:alpha/beta hydrolase [Hyphomicrobiales bacterium]MCP5372987.1 alpha/beta hydrolase [Hyphomicrobiales bacterium]
MRHRLVTVLLVSCFLALSSGPGSAATGQAGLADLVRVFGEYGQARERGDPAAALDLARRAVDLGEQVYGAGGLDMARLLETLADALVAAGRPAEAAPVLRRALAVREAAQGAEHPDLAVLLGRLADLALAEKDYDTARSLRKRALTIDERTYGPVHLNTAADLDKLAQVDEAAGDWTQAGVLRRRADTARKEAAKRAEMLDRRPSGTAMGEVPAPVRGKGDAKAAVDGARPFAVVRVFYGTNRARTGSAKPAQFYGTERGDLEMGHVDVSIPFLHQVGRLESPSSLMLDLVENPRNHVVLLTVTPLKKRAFLRSLKQNVRGGSGEVLVFVHGYNVSFNDGARRAAQLSYDLNFDGTTLLYSWPSQAGTFSYITDEAAVKVSSRKLRTFLLMVAEQSGAERIHVIAHSMGNRATMEALELLALGWDREEGAPKLFDQVILTAPDVDSDYFAEMSGEIRNLARRVTLYASENDRALTLSNELHGGHPRAGQSGPDILVLPQVDTVDMSRVETDALGHSYFGDHSGAIYDIFSLLWRNLPPEQRCGMKATPKGDLKFWTFVPGDCGNPVLRNASLLVKRYGAEARERAIAQVAVRHAEQDAEGVREWTRIVRQVEKLITAGPGAD